MRRTNRGQLASSRQGREQLNKKRHAAKLHGSANHRDMGSTRPDLDRAAEAWLATKERGSWKTKSGKQR